MEFLECDEAREATMSRVRLIHWNAAEARERARRLEDAGFVVSAEPPTGPGLMQELRGAAPDTIVIDLSPLPSQGRAVVLTLRTTKSTRQVPFVFVGGDSAKISRTGEFLPDAVFTTRDSIVAALSEAISHPLAAPLKIESVFAGYSGRPLPAKMGIKPGFHVALVDGPPDFAETLGDLPAGVQFADHASDDSDLILCFVRSRRDLERAIADLAPVVQTISIWFIWPKKASGVVTDVSEPFIREAGLAAGLVDFKVAAIDATWSGLLFRRRKRPQTDS